MEIEEVKRAIISQITPHKLSPDQRWLYVRCPYCGDSRKNANHVHMGISLTPPFYYHCLRCDTGGPLTKRVLNDIGIFNNDLILSVNKINKSEYGKNNINYKSILSKPNKVVFPKLTGNNIEKRNLEYFNKRFGTNLDAEYITEKFKVILNPFEFFKTNRISTKFNYSNFIGFVSADEGYGIFRDTTGKLKVRYNNCKFAGDGIECSKIYSIRSKIDIMQDEITLVMTEGIFDIIGIYLAEYKDTEKETNAIFAAACGKGYNAVINHFIRKGFLNLKIIIYSDNDVSREKLLEIKDSNYIIRNQPITVYYNELSKDVGVPKEQIKLRRMVI